MGDDEGRKEGVGGGAEAWCGVYKHDSHSLEEATRGRGDGREIYADSVHTLADSHLEAEV
jgi:hypothetical protein